MPAVILQPKNKMKILITGTAGFLGSNLSERLLLEGHQVWGVDNLSTGRLDSIAHLIENPGFTFKNCSIETKAFFDFCSSAGSFDRVYHLACPTGVPNISILGEEMLRVCSIGTWQVLQVAQ